MRSSDIDESSLLLPPASSLSEDKAFFYLFLCSFLSLFSCFRFSSLSCFSTRPVNMSLLTKSTWFSSKRSYCFSTLLAFLFLTPKLDLAYFSLSNLNFSSSVSSGGPPLGLLSWYFWFNLLNRRSWRD